MPGQHHHEPQGSFKLLVISALIVMAVVAVIVIVS